ncbi:NAD(P)-binding domain-containing protein [Weissella ceti]|uniref:NAD(P)-binding domain-containing protein n=1 Tax=Weissella ceti TaxID=759620 RepID=A0ABT3E5T5_9LACO|nr:NAD(P)-binding domain-containing protein [Weissella ceti]MCW0953740.1 NAD(P)-binding domain-containing protein [Weissella ceti]QVK11427.1 NAD(P)-binding domain-containing protein [Weissella ceti]
MKISVIGFGNIGSAVVNNLLNNGSDHEIYLANRSFDKIQKFADAHGDNVHAVSEEEAVKQGDVLILTMWMVQQLDFINRYYEQLGNKIVIDPSNPVGYNSQGESRRTLPEGLSSGEVIRFNLPEGVGYIKAFGTMGADSLADEASADKSVVLYYATDSAENDRLAEELIKDSGYFPLNADTKGLNVSGYGHLEVGGELHQYGGLEGQVPTKELAEKKLAEFKEAHKA